jgi:ABC-type transport system substrate-binding protein
MHVFKNDRGELQSEINPPAIADRCGGTYRWTYNVERAKELLAKAGYPGGKGLPTFKFDTRATEVSERQLAEFLSKGFEKIGVHTEIIANTFPAYLDKIRKGNVQISKGGWSMDYPDAENSYQLLYGKNKAPGPNDSNFENAEFDALYEKLAIMPSGPARRQIACRLEAIVQEEAPWGYGFYENKYYLAQKRLKNFHTADLIFTKWKYVDLDSSEQGASLSRR